MLWGHPSKEVGVQQKEHGAQSQEDLHLRLALPLTV